MTWRCCEVPRSALVVVVGARVGPVVVEQPARRPVLVRLCVTPARAVEGGDVLERDENVPVQLDVGDLVDVAVGGEDALLVLAAEEGYLDLFALVLGRVVLHLRVSLSA